jgi:hypothetical protein
MLLSRAMLCIGRVFQYRLLTRLFLMMKSIYYYFATALHTGAVEDFIPQSDYIVLHDEFAFSLDFISCLASFRLKVSTQFYTPPPMPLRH